MTQLIRFKDLIQGFNIESHKEGEWKDTFIVVRFSARNFIEEIENVLWLNLMLIFGLQDF